MKRISDKESTTITPIQALDASCIIATRGSQGSIYILTNYRSPDGPLRSFFVTLDGHQRIAEHGDYETTIKDAMNCSAFTVYAFDNAEEFGDWLGGHQ